MFLLQLRFSRRDLRYVNLIRWVTPFMLMSYSKNSLEIEDLPGSLKEDASEYLGLRLQKYLVFFFKSYTIEVSLVVLYTY